MFEQDPKYEPLLPQDILDKQLLVKVPSDLHKQFQEVCELNHTTMSEAIRQYMMIAVRSGHLK